MPEESEVTRRSRNFKRRYKEIQGMRGTTLRSSTHYGSYSHKLGEALEASAKRHGDGYSPLEVITIRKGYGHILSEESQE